MNDTEVGELWRIAVERGFHHRWGDVGNLIHKLVKERADLYRADGHDEPERLACESFGIDAAIWKGFGE